MIPEDIINNQNSSRPIKRPFKSTSALLANQAKLDKLLANQEVIQAN